MLYTEKIVFLFMLKKHDFTVKPLYEGIRVEINYLIFGLSKYNCMDIVYSQTVTKLYHTFKLYRILAYPHII